MIVNCRTAAALISRSMDARLSPYEKLKVRVHLFLCRYVGGEDCSKYQSQIQFLHQAAGRLPRPKAPGLSPADKKALKKAVRESMKTLRKAKG